MSSGSEAPTTSWTKYRFSGVEVGCVSSMSVWAVKRWIHRGLAGENFLAARTEGPSTFGDHLSELCQRVALVRGRYDIRLM